MSLRYWHASFDPLPVGTVLVPRPDYEARWTSNSVGRILEDMRPPASLAHRDAVFMCDDPQECDNAGANCEWLFEVVPTGKVQRHDMDWPTTIDSMVSDGWPPDDARIVELARRYWSGEASDMPTWEYLARSAAVTSVEPY